MDMAFDEAENDIPPLSVDDLGLLPDGAFDISDGRYAIACYGHATGIDLASIHVDDLSVGNNQIRFLLTACHCQ